MEDSEGLKAAYDLDNGVYPPEDTMFVASTKSLRDAWDDLKIPVGQTARTQRYSDTSRARKQCRRSSASLDTRSGERWLSSFSNKDPGFKSVTYGAPVASATSGARGTHLGDPVGAFDMAAQTTLPGGLNPHSNHTLATRCHEFAKGTTMDGYYDGDKSLSLYT
jgi:hypothetical protein